MSKYWISWKEIIPDTTSRMPAVGTYCRGCKALHGEI